jgi:hypothetical protein
MSTEHRSLDVLIQEMLDGVLDEDQRADLLERVESDNEARKRYLDQIATHTALQAVLADCLPQTVGAPGILNGETQSTFVLKSRWPAIAVIGSLAATILLLLGSIAYLGSREPKVVQSGSPPHPAMITQAVGAYDRDGVAIRSGQSVESGQLSVDRGVVRLDFVNGARLAVEGPAKIEVVDDMRVVLLNGVITATIPESAIGFVVDTGTARVVDLGTSFGVSVGDDGTTDVCVFEGEVTVRRKGSAASQPALVREGEAVRASESSPTVDSADYQVAAFENAWPVNSGVLQTTGSIRFVSPGPDFHPGNYEDNEHIVVFPERHVVTPDESIRVDMVDPGEYVKSRYREKRVLPSGRRVASYLLQFDAFPTGPFPNRKRSVRGQITFANPIVGVITETRLLKESEAIFGNPNVEYPIPRAVEPRPEGDERPGFDSVILAADQRTLILDLKVAPQKLDQLRVLVEAE